MDKIKSINISFENCESFIIPSNCIDFMKVEGFKTVYVIRRDGNYVRYNRAYYVSINLKSLNEITPDYESEPFIKRIRKHNDISSITYNFQNGKKFEFYVPWDFNDHQYNSWQKLKEFKDGSIQIEIKNRRNKKL